LAAQCKLNPSFCYSLEDVQKESAMKISKTMATGLMATMMAAAVYSPAFADLFDQPSLKPEANRMLEGPCEPLTWEAANKLPWWVRAGDVACMSVSVDDFQASQQAQALLVEAAGQMRDEGASSAQMAEAQYKDGVEAYAEGKYADAITHFRAAMPSVSPVDYNQ
jgi:hypothetical protein